MFGFILHLFVLLCYVNTAWCYSQRGIRIEKISYQWLCVGENELDIFYIYTYIRIPMRYNGSSALTLHHHWASFLKMLIFFCPNGFCGNSKRNCKIFQVLKYTKGKNGSEGRAICKKKVIWMFPNSKSPNNQQSPNNKIISFWAEKSKLKLANTI